MHYFKFYNDVDYKIDEVTNFQIFASCLNKLNDKEEGVIKCSEPSLESLANEIISRNNRRAVSCLVRSDSNHAVSANDYMWEKYANHHKGFCIEYNERILDGLQYLTTKLRADQLYNVYINVEYGPEQLIIDRIDSAHDMIESLGHKLDKWKQEQETRLIFRFPPEDSSRCIYKKEVLVGELVPIKAKEKAYCAIYLGKYASVEFMKPVIAFADKNKIPCYKMELSMTRIV